MAAAMTAGATAEREAGAATEPAESSDGIPARGDVRHLADRSPARIDREHTHMSLQSLIVILLIGAVAGWLAGVLMRGRGFGILGNIVVGIVGALCASWLLPMVGISIGGGILGSIIHATIGAVILLFVIGLIKKA